MVVVPNVSGCPNIFTAEGEFGMRTLAMMGFANLSCIVSGRMDARNVRAPDSAPVNFQKPGMEKNTLLSSFENQKASTTAPDSASNSAMMTLPGILSFATMHAKK